MVIKLIKYPNNIVKEKKEKADYKTYSNRGLTLEDDLNNTNLYYLEKDIAVVYKKPTPIQIVSKINNKITEAFFKSPSTTDYNGLYRGKYIDFEAKETKSLTSFPISNIHKHQIIHLENVLHHEGICFLIIRFTKLNETYILLANDFLSFVNNNNRKSIPYSYFKEKAYLIKDKIKPRVDYISILEKYGGIK